MKTKRPENNFWDRLRKILQRQPGRHDPLLVLNLLNFNFTGGWERTFSKYEYARSQS